ncbi:prolipoprotein diacylglyceryl transferase [Treponema pallidum]|uniref:Phosphatidylglycerol--prolipoprotein diacylglyceryl transferase n=2 Tax=Treponema pallidum subsp. pallidum TaxID=161 RepID=LGT_TREPA|nr:prolipoprotein diacylglyceryl transferase [Treponema pallidum]O83824.1 RecName: Full=Phosphatidylglycerol--prolipoprotein diacylglyceryl transferase [Treponema pallidum subsp. pallidum str. Nichols]AAC65817.1 prolipoprotein diacylglyceryl transferase (lgt) [Treponema pallidum subsp. pallidum str. Nichols]ACD71269.1 prolipoprotein diacylglyceryl transferase [Treponema pallidum subsp. pallidum SS14]ADD72945.1 prolipoprotein diacylglyceryl transferase [Treponema pallidum subsp. pallidum str. Ch
MLSIVYPSWIRPEIIPSFPYFRWYGFMYVVAFSIAYILFRYQVRRGELDKWSRVSEPVTQDDIMSFFTWTILGILIGARVFSTMVYEVDLLYMRKPWLIFWPFSLQTGEWVGLRGMSYHGGLIGALVGGGLWTQSHGRSFLAWADVAAASTPLGYTFGRIGNFLNAELYGRITDIPIGMIFPNVPLSDMFPASEPWVREFAQRVGIHVQEGARLVNLPRHPSQIYEAFFEGIVLWCILWCARRVKTYNGFLVCLYVVGYGVFRFFIEYFRQPDAHLGYRFSATQSSPIYLFQSWSDVSTGQILCVLMILAGLGGMFALSAYHKRDSVRKARV